MAIQIRRGTNAGWEASKSNIVVGEPAVTTDTERAFIGTGSGTYMELANLERIAPAYDTSVEYATGDIVSWQGELYKAIAPTSGAFNIAYWEKMTFADILKDFNEHKYDGYETATIEDVEIASFDNGASGIAVKDLQVDIEATQDLHGYSHPWAGGAGKNLIDGEFTTNASGTTSHIVAGYKLPTQGSTVTCSGTASGTVMNVSNSVVNFKNGSTQVWAIGPGQTKEVPDLSSVNTIEIYTTATYANKEIKLQIEVGSSATAYEPFANICPINGFDEVVVNVATKNWLIPSRIVKDKYVGVTDGSLINYNGWSASDYIPMKPNTHYRILKLDNGEYAEITNSNCYWACYDENFARITGMAHKDIFTSDNAVKWVRVSCPTSYFNESKGVFVDIADAPLFVTESDYTCGNGYTTAVNVWDEVIEKGNINSTTGQDAEATSGAYWRSKNYIPILGGSTIYSKLADGYTTSNSNIQLYFYDSSKSFLGTVANYGDKEYTLASNCAYVRFVEFFSPARSDAPTGISINYPSTEHSYIPYKGLTATRNCMDTFGHGVYGGTLDVTTGMLTVTHGFVGDISALTAYGSFTTGTYSVMKRFTLPSPSNTTIASQTHGAISNMGVETASYYGTNRTNESGSATVDFAISTDGTLLAIYDKNTALTEADFMTKYASFAVMYPLATPQTVQLTEQEVETVYKNNNIWANSGDIKVFVYRMTRH